MVAGGFSALAIYLVLSGACVCVHVCVGRWRGGGGVDGDDQRIFGGLKFDFWLLLFWGLLFQ